jgi:hypothetical protein
MLGRREGGKGHGTQRRARGSSVTYTTGRCMPEVIWPALELEECGMAALLTV